MTTRWIRVTHNYSGVQRMIRLRGRLNVRVRAEVNPLHVPGTKSTMPCRFVLFVCDGPRPVLTYANRIGRWLIGADFKDFMRGTPSANNMVDGVLHPIRSYDRWEVITRTRKKR